MTAPTCATCRWWAPEFQTALPSQCRVKAPVRIDGESKWPVTWSFDWCGEHAPKGGQ